MIKAIIFDLDGVIMDTVDYHYQSWQSLSTSLGYNLPTDIKHQLKGLNREASLDIVLAYGNILASDSERNEYLHLKNKYYLESLPAEEDSYILPGIKGFLDSAQKQGLKMAIASASKNARRIIQKTSITDYFQCIVDGNDVTRSKPDPEVFLTAAKMINVSPSETIVIEDSPQGIDAAITGGFLTVGIGNANHLTEANIVLADLTHISADMFVRLLS